jgi:hypothetical protein
MISSHQWLTSIDSVVESVEVIERQLRLQWQAFQRQLS